MRAVLIILALVAPFGLCLILAQIQLGRQRYRTYLFEQGWGPHDWHEWIEHPVYKGRIVCRYCPVEALESDKKLIYSRSYDKN